MALNATDATEPCQAGEHRNWLEENSPSLIAGVCQKDPLAMQAFFHIYQPAVYRYVAHMSRSLSSQDIDDIAQEALVVAMLKLPTFRGNSLLRTWVLGVARNVVLDRLRKFRSRSRYEVTLADLSPDWEVADEIDANDPLQHTLRRDEAERLRRALGAVKPEWRTMLILRYVDNLPVREVARTVGKSVSTIEKSLIIARRQLQAVLSA